MEKKSVVNFSKFYEGNQEKRKPFGINDLGRPLYKEISEDKQVPKKIKSNTVSLEEKIDNLKKVEKPIFREIVHFKDEEKVVEKSKIEDEKEKVEDTVEYPDVVSDIIEEPELDPSFDPPVDVEELLISDPISDKDQVEEEEYLPSLSNDNNFNDVEEEEKISKDDYYPVFKDKFENFSCNVMVEGAKLTSTKARLILESDDWNLVFDGEIDETGRCNIPIKKLNILDEGTVGKIRLEVIAENTIFSPWEDNFKVKVDKKVAVQVPKKRLPKAPNVSVNFSKK